MGMYTELHLYGDLKKEIPDDVLTMLKFMCGMDKEVEPPMLDHPLFNCSRWRFMLNCDSAYFAARTLSEVIESVYEGEIMFRTLNVRCNVKNYSNEIQEFVKWIMPWIDETPGDFLGFMRYEEDHQATWIHKVKE